MKLRTLSEETVTVNFGKGDKHFRRLKVIGAGREFREQVCEIDLPGDHPAVGLDKVIDFELHEVSGLFQAKPRLKGTILNVPSSSGKP